MSLDGQAQTVRPLRWYLYFPWIALVLVWLALVTGITDWISTVLPFGLGRIAIRNLWPGMLLLLVGCSALWAFEVQRYWDCRGVGLVFGTIWLTILVILFQICVAIAIVSVGWVLVSALITEQH